MSYESKERWAELSPKDQAWLEELRESAPTPTPVEKIDGKPFYELAIREVPSDDHIVLLYGGTYRNGDPRAVVKIIGSGGLLRTIDASGAPWQTFCHPYASIYSPSLSDKREL